MEYVPRALEQRERVQGRDLCLKGYEVSIEGREMGK